MKEIVVTIKNPLIDSKTKLLKVVQSLSKAMRLQVAEEINKREVSPYRAVRDSEKRIEKQMDEALMQLFDAIRKTWIGSALIKAAEIDPFKLKKIRINPKTGKPLTRKEWSEIQSSLDKVLKRIFKQQEDYISKRSIALGKILATMPAEERLNSSLDAIESKYNLDALWHDDYLKNVVNWADVNTAQYVTDLTARSRKNVVSTLVSAEKNQLSSKEMEKQLFDTFSSMNRDWRRIAETEHASNVTNGLLTTELHNNNNEAKLMQGVSMGNACQFCQSHINGKVVALVATAPAEGDSVEINGKQYTAIWPGKNNVGRARADWWVCAPAHPHCKCSFVPYEEGFDKYLDQLKTKIYKEK